jgi:hypothetical protein
MKTVNQALIAALLMALAAPSFAEGFAVQVSGNYNTRADVGNVSSTANGRGTHADINVAGIQGNAQVTGAYNAVVSAGNITSNAQGDGASANVNLGGIQTYKQP